jgi:hypothetical protein
LSAAFTNTGSVITQFPLGGTNFRLSLNGGGGNATLAVPRFRSRTPMACCWQGLGLFVFIARRKSNRFTVLI